MALGTGAADVDDSTVVVRPGVLADLTLVTGVDFADLLLFAPGYRTSSTVTITGGRRGRADDFRIFV